jgi:phosphoribosylanthranilate isomerase
MIPIKFCGLSTPETVAAAVRAGAGWLGFVFFPRSPRHLEPERAAALTALVPPGIGRVAVLVDADDALIDAVIAAGIDTLQLHGRETPERIAAVKARTGLPVWAARGVANRADIAAAIAGAGPADRLLLDAKPPAGAGARVADLPGGAGVADLPGGAGVADLPGGNGVAFDWRLMLGVQPPLPWGLSGGLDAGNVGAALAVLQPAFVDVSSGTEERPGVKSIAKIMAFADAVRAA